VEIIRHAWKGIPFSCCKALHTLRLQQVPFTLVRSALCTFSALMPMLHVCNQHENALSQSNEAEHCCHPVLHDISDVFCVQKQLISRNSITKHVFFRFGSSFQL
jgi:hypothetical protein